MQIVAFSFHSLLFYSLNKAVLKEICRKTVVWTSLHLNWSAPPVHKWWDHPGPGFGLWGKKTSPPQPLYREDLFKRTAIMETVWPLISMQMDMHRHTNGGLDTRACVHTHTHTTYGSRRLCVLADNSCIFRAQKRSAVWDTAGLSDVLHGLRGEHWLGGTANPERERERRKGRKRKEIRPHTRVLVMRGWCHLNKCSPNIINTVLLAN